MMDRSVPVTVGGFVAAMCVALWASFVWIDRANVAWVERFDNDPGCARRLPVSPGSACTWSTGVFAAIGPHADPISVMLYRPEINKLETVTLHGRSAQAVVAAYTRYRYVRVETFGNKIVRVETAHRSFRTFRFPELATSLVETYGTTLIVVWQAAVTMLIVALLSMQIERRRVS